MPSTLTFDARGRVTIPADLRRGLGDEVVAVKTPRGILLYPVPKHVDVPIPASKASGEDAAWEEVDAEQAKHARRRP